MNLTQPQPNPILVFFPHLGLCDGTIITTQSVGNVCVPNTDELVAVNYASADVSGEDVNIMRVRDTSGHEPAHTYRRIKNEARYGKQ